jgi:aryl-alcohol dehydrogenase-like predicted oxidoreductase
LEKVYSGFSPILSITMSDPTNPAVNEANPFTAEIVERRVGTTPLLGFPLSLGAAIFGWTLPSGRATNLMDRFVELGGTFVDTADAYSSGMSEQIIGNWMRERENRDRVVVSTKVGRLPDHLGLAPRTIREAVDASLVRLQTDHIDVLYFHADDKNVPIEESLSAVGDLIQAGKVRYLGASNYSAPRLMEARVASAAGLPRFEAVALEYSLMRRDIVEGNLAMIAQAQEVAIMPYFTLANGFLGRHRNIRAFTSSDIRARRAFSHAGRHGTQVLKALDNIAMGHGVDISAIALAWVLAQPGVGIPIIGPESIRELEALMHAPMIVLTHAEIAELDKASAESQRTWTGSRKK